MTTPGARNMAKRRQYAPSILLATLSFLVFASCDSSPQAPQRYSESEIAYFDEVLFGNLKTAGQEPELSKWTASPTIIVVNAPGGILSGLVQPVVTDLNQILDGRLTLRTEWRSREEGCGMPRARTVCLRYVSPEEYKRQAPVLFRTGFGFFILRRTLSGELFDGDIYIAVDSSRAGTVPEAIAYRQLLMHATREEITQTMGPTRDSNRFPRSIFYDPPSTVTEYATIDRVIIDMLYRPEIEPGMTRTEALAVLRTINRSS